MRISDRISSGMEKLVNYLTVLGFIGTVSVVVKFLNSTPYIRLSNTGIWGVTIQGVPFLWIVSSLTLLNMRNFWNASKGLTNSSSQRLSLVIAILVGVFLAYAALRIITGT